MTPKLLYLAAALALTSCAEYHYIKLAGDNIRSTEGHTFVCENDTLRVEYRFSGYRGHVDVTVFNRSSEPLIVDWWKSAIIVGDRAASFHEPTATVSAQVTQNKASVGTATLGSTYLADANGSINLSQPSQFIPPGTAITKELNSLPVDTLRAVGDRAVKIETFPLPTGGTLTAKRAGFTKEGSPMTVRSYLTLRMGQAGAEKELRLEHRFFVAEVWKTLYSGSYLPELLRQGDMFYFAP